MRQLHEHKLPGIASSLGTWCALASAFHPVTLHLVHTKSLPNCLSGMDNSNTE